MVPMCLADVEDGSVLEIKDDEVIVNPNMDFTNLSQHWYIYPGKKDRAFTIVSRKEQKVLQWDDNAELIVKNCDIDEEDAQWIILNGCFVVKKKWYMKDKRFNAHPMVSVYCSHDHQGMRRCRVGRTKLHLLETKLKLINHALTQ